MALINTRGYGSRRMDTASGANKLLKDTVPDI